MNSTNNCTFLLQFNSSSTSDQMHFVFEDDGTGTYEHVCQGCGERDSQHTKCREKACRTQLYNDNIQSIKEGYMRVIKYMTHKWWQF